MKILVSGSLAYDRIMDFPGYFKDHILPEKVHLLNVSFEIKILRENFGGTAGNIAYNLKLLKEDPTIISTAGRDFENYRQWLGKNGISLQEIRIISKELTPSAYIITDRANNQITAFHKGAMIIESSLHLGNYKALTPKNTMAIIAPGNRLEMVDFGRLLKKKNIPYIFDPGQQIPALSNRDLRFLLKGAKIFAVNDYEFSLISKRLSLKLSQMKKMAETVIITKGEKGSKVITSKKSYPIKAVKPRKIVDPTGAGDAYRAGLIKGLLENYPIKKTAQLASLVATYPIEHYGTQEHHFSFREIKNRYYQKYKAKLN